jgi:cytochrome bd-type quinol oxidase subunit 1
MVVISGPDATAGSTWILLKNSGMSVPTALDITIATKSEKPITADIAKAV